MTVENAVKNNGGKNMSYNEFLPCYSIGDDCYKEIPYVTRRYGKTAVVIGGKTAMEKAKPELLAALKGSDLEITDFIWYGGDSNYENIEMLKAMPEVQNADMVFGVGGGRAVDTVKTLCDRIDKPFFTFPTLASNCASCTAISVIYNADGTFKEYAYLKAPALHTFINTKIIAESPEKLFWAGIGDALSKEYEVVYTDRTEVEFRSDGQWESVGRKYSPVPASIVPQPIQTFVSGSNYPGQFIRQIARNAYTWEVELSNGLEIKFDNQFNVIDIDD